MRPTLSAQALQAGASLQPGDYDVAGDLLVHGEDALLVVDGVQAGRVRITDPEFLGRLVEAVPCYVGGPYLYSDPVRLQVRVEHAGDEIVIAVVESGELIREDEGAYSL